MQMDKPIKWKAVIPESLRQPALEVAHDVAERVRDPERTAEIARLSSEQSGPDTIRQRRWTPSSVTYGHAAPALLFGQLDRCFPGQEWDRLAHTYLVPAVRSLEDPSGHSIFPGLFGGLAGLCFVANYLSRDGTRYQRLLGTLDELLFQQTIEVARLPDPFPGGVGFNDYDLISGPAGIGAYLLLRLDVPRAATALDAVVDRLVFLSEWQTDGRLRLFIPPEWQPTERHLEQNPDGATDCGLAHGVPGPLAFLALARMHGVERPGLGEAIRRLADWIVAQQYEDGWGINWPYTVAPDGVEPPPVGTTRAAWCYGSPGVAPAGYGLFRRHHRRYPGVVGTEKRHGPERFRVAPVCACLLPTWREVRLARSLPSRVDGRAIVSCLLVDRLGVLRLAQDPRCFGRAEQPPQVPEVVADDMVIAFVETFSVGEGGGQQSGEG